MNQLLPIVYLARHGETAWTLSGQYTGFTELPLTERFYVVERLSSRGHVTAQAPQPEPEATPAAALPS